ncbi:unnamed protein product, partial [Didymodactylos carnosus]
IPRYLLDDPSIIGTLDVFQILIDRAKISQKDFTYPIKAFEVIKRFDAADYLKGSSSSIEIAIYSRTWFFCFLLNRTCLFT